MSASIFEDKKSKKQTKSLSVKLPIELSEAIDEVNTKLAEIDSTKKFNVNAICVDAIQKATRRAKRELDTMG